jgi:hypothetical protein
MLAKYIRIRPLLKEVEIEPIFSASWYKGLITVFQQPGVFIPDEQVAGNGVSMAVSTGRFCKVH